VIDFEGIFLLRLALLDFSCFKSAVIISRNVDQELKVHSWSFRNCFASMDLLGSMLLSQVFNSIFWLDFRSGQIYYSLYFTSCYFLLLHW